LDITCGPGGNLSPGEGEMSKPNAKETSQRPKGDDKTTLGGFEGCLGFELGIAGHET
jgi:hypothetical protein